MTPPAEGAPVKPIGAKRPDAKAAKPEKPRKQASALILSGLSLATILLCLLPLYAAHVFVVKNSQLNPFAALPPWGAEAAIWGVTVFLPFLGVLSALFAPFRFRWAHMGLIWFWILAGAGLGAVWGLNFEAFILAVQSVFKQAQVDFGAVPQLVSAFSWCADQSVPRVPLLTIVAGVSIAIAVLGVGYLLWRYPRVKWGPMAKPPATKYGKKKGATATVPKPAPTPPREGFSMARACCRLVFLGWVFIFLPFWLLNELIVIFGWSAQLAFPTARAFEMALPVEKLKVFLHILPVIALIGMGMVLPRWRPYRGTIRAARLMGLASTVFLVLTCGLLPVNHLLMSRQPKPAPPPPEDVPDVPPPQPDPEPPKPQPPAGLSPAQAETKRAGDQKLSRATELLQELQIGVRSGRSGLKPKANEVDVLLGGAIELYEKIQVELDGAGAKIPRELSSDLKRATESRKLLRMLRGEMK
jgi:hypothetical protein